MVFINYCVHKSLKVSIWSGSNWQSNHIGNREALIQACGVVQNTCSVSWEYCSGIFCLAIIRPYLLAPLIKINGTSICQITILFMNYKLAVLCSPIFFFPFKPPHFLFFCSFEAQGSALILFLLDMIFIGCQILKI